MMPDSVSLTVRSRRRVPTTSPMSRPTASWSGRSLPPHSSKSAAAKVKWASRWPMRPATPQITILVIALASINTMDTPRARPASRRADALPHPPQKTRRPAQKPLGRWRVLGAQRPAPFARPACVILPSGCRTGPAGMPRIFISVLTGTGLRALHSTGPYALCSVVATPTMPKSGANFSAKLSASSSWPALSSSVSRWMGPGMTLDITEITPAARISALFIIGTVLSSSPERMVKSSPQSRRVLAMLSKSPVASLT